MEAFSPETEVHTGFKMGMGTLLWSMTDFDAAGKRIPNNHRNSSVDEPSVLSSQAANGAPSLQKSPGKGQLPHPGYSHFSSSI